MIGFRAAPANVVDSLSNVNMAVVSKKMKMSGNALVLLAALLSFLHCCKASKRLSIFNFSQLSADVCTAWRQTSLSVCSIPQNIQLMSGLAG